MKKEEEKGYEKRDGKKYEKQKRQEKCKRDKKNSGWSGGAMVPGKLPVSGRSAYLIIVGQGPTAFVVGAGGGCLDVFSLVYHFSFLSPCLWETPRYRLEYCLKGPLNPKQPTNQSEKLSK